MVRTYTAYDGTTAYSNPPAKTNSVWVYKTSDVEHRVTVKPSRVKNTLLYRKYLGGTYYEFD